MTSENILVVEDEKDILDLVDFNLAQAGYEVLRAGDGLDGLRLAREHLPKLIILDLMLPNVEGQEVLRRLRRDERTSRIPVLVLTALSSPTDRIVGFEIGADDYLTKPFSPRELVLRVKAILRRMRGPAEAETVLKLGGLTIDPERYLVEAGGEPLELTTTEFKLLTHLASRAGRVQTRQQLLEQVWGYEYEGYSRTVDTHIRRLRKKLGELGDNIETIRGLGYRFREQK